MTPAFRIGQGFDVHALVAGHKLILGGVEIPYPKDCWGIRMPMCYFMR
jgi:2-C-methyl-D-erythritol 2,4-cyclodiphosphate synthase